MQEECEFRVSYELADMLFRPDEAKVLRASEYFPPSVKKVRISTVDPRYREVGRLQKQIREACGSPFFFGWKYFRKYTPKELSSADLFYLNITAKFEPAGEECLFTIHPQDVPSVIAANNKRQI